jgi:hypothetical protein
VSGFGYSRSQLHFHSGNTWTHLRQSIRAREEHTRALEFYPDSDHTDRAPIELDLAACLVADGDPEGAALLAAQTLTTLPPEYRSALVTSRAREVVDTVPNGRELQVLHDALAPPPGK